jgi:hypothetical protein
MPKRRSEGPEIHAIRAAQLGADEVKIQFSPQVAGHVARLVAAVAERKDFPKETRSFLEGIASGEHLGIDEALVGLSLSAQEILKHVQATGDTAAQVEFDELLDSLVLDPQGKPLTLLRTRGPKER